MVEVVIDKSLQPECCLSLAIVRLLKTMCTHDSSTHLQAIASPGTGSNLVPQPFATALSISVSCWREQETSECMSHFLSGLQERSRTHEA